jgi:hypothetical protein
MEIIRKRQTKRQRKNAETPVFKAYSIDELNLAEGLWWICYGALVAGLLL